MEDIIQTIGAGSGYALLALAVVVWWRMYRYLEKQRDDIAKDRDYWQHQAMVWRTQALDRTEALDRTLDAAEALVPPLKVVEQVLPQEESRLEQLEELIRLLARERQA